MTFEPAPGKTPLHRKLGCRPDTVVHLLGAPDGFADYLRDHGFETAEHPAPDDLPQGIGHVHVFATTRAEVVHAMQVVDQRLARDGRAWLSWPKRASKVPTDIDKALLHRRDAFGDLVDVKVCAVDATWSGLMYMVRKERR
jgi:hypothetical protein